jgi:rod shape-determining protein MreC
VRQSWRTNRLIFLIVMLFLCGGLMVLSIIGISSQVEGIAAMPLNSVSGVFSRLSLTLNQAFEDLNDIGRLSDRVAELEEQLARQQVELIQLREVASDYNRLTGLLAYTSNIDNQEFVTADVIAVDQSSIARSIIINRGTRDGIAVGMLVTTDLGLVGRIIRVSSNASQVQLVNDENSAVSARLQTTRAEGSIIGQASGVLRMTFIDLDEDIVQNDLVITSGLGGNFPPDIVIGQVTSIRQFEFELFQEAEVRSLVDFETLEFVLVITSFQPVDLSIFDEPEEGQ